MPRIYRRIIRLHSRPGHHLPQQVLLLFLSLYYDSTKIVQLILSKSLRSSWNTAVDVAIRLLMAVGPWIPFRYRPDNFLHPQSPDQTGSGVHPASSLMVIGVLTWRQSGRNLTLTTRVHLVPKREKTGLYRYGLHVSSRCGQGKPFPLYLISI
jgi:hypothetical protein